MDAKDLEQLIKWLGIPGAMLAVFIYWTSKGYLLWSREHLDIIRLKDLALQEKDKHIAEKNADCIKSEQELLARIESMKVEKNFWRQIALGGQEELERATRTVEKAVEKLPRSTSVLPPEGE